MCHVRISDKRRISQLFSPGHDPYNTADAWWFMAKFFDAVRK